MLAQIPSEPVLLLLILTGATAHCVCASRVKDKNGETVFGLVSNDDSEIRTLLRKSQAQASIAQSDVANGERTELGTPISRSHSPLGLDDDDDEEGSGSGSDDE